MTLWWLAGNSTTPGLVQPALGKQFPDAATSTSPAACALFSAITTSALGGFQCPAHADDMGTMCSGPIDGSHNVHQGLDAEFAVTLRIDVMVEQTDRHDVTVPPDTRHALGVVCLGGGHPGTEGAVTANIVGCVRPGDHVPPVGPGDVFTREIGVRQIAPRVDDGDDDGRTAL